MFFDVHGTSNRRSVQLHVHIHVYVIWIRLPAVNCLNVTQNDYTSLNCGGVHDCVDRWS